MNNTKKYFYNIILLSINASLFAPVPININPTNNNTVTTTSPQNPVATNYQEPAPRNIIVLLDDGSENPKNELYGPGTFKTFLNYLNGDKNYETPVILDQLISGLNSDPASAIFASESIVNSLIARQTIVKDFINLSEDELTKKYGDMTKFNDPTMRSEFKKTCIMLSNGLTLAQNSFKEYSENPTPNTLSDFSNIIQKIHKDYDDQFDEITKNLFDGDATQTDIFCDDIKYNYFPSNNALDLSKWKLGKTPDGSYLFLPLNDQGIINSTALNYKDISGFNGITIPNPFRLATQ